MVDYAVALKCARLCQEVYRDFNGLRFSSYPDVEPVFVESQDNGFTDTQVSILNEMTSDRLYIVFRGSDKSIDWMNNVQFRQQVYPYGDGNTEVKFHQGFMTAYFAVRKQLLDAMEKFVGQHVIVTGHSLGGALATIAALDIQYNLGGKRDLSFEVYTFGAPRVGNRAMVESYNGRIPNSYRFIYGWDIVTRIPRTWQGFDHVEKAIQLGSRWTWQVLSRRFSDHSIDGYIADLEAEAKAA
ncbi:MULTISPECIES: lipase family protein [Cyanophyceae]|uniref:Lipase family protein n=1 Tax=Leptolyngbya subtilissima DQ-A4 TaxID=2933933 RepID=A0ABV0K8V7_9CYAN|nr:lipase family protein [Nodosilinea sp. FACHB-141]MBD2114127.1 lipase family protein [Nodosilinea sp. FACHB-141]